MSNRYEKAADELLQTISTDMGDRLVPKMRLADVVDIDSLDDLATRDRWFALSTHLDFVMLDHESGLPKFAVEMDGRQHWTDLDQRRKDAIKDRICEDAELPLLRVTSDFVTRSGRWPLLSYAVNAFYRSEAFFEAQESGLIPEDELFHHGSFITPADDGAGFLMSTFDAAAIQGLWKLHAEGQIPRSLPNVFRVRPAEDRGVRAIAYLPVAKDRYLISETRVRDFRFQGISAQDLAEEICIVDIANMVTAWLADEPVACNSAAMRKKAEEIQHLIETGQIGGSACGAINIEGSEPFTIRIHLGR
ncbi:DUF2726 domain-containing protein [Lentzea sp. CA-135723]|uniref:DUF2726 domain-containing protein n=1 Tax=Lentzea sp. CA-135723 TaxID=3239950 RepID=UPI003D8BF343